MALAIGTVAFVAWSAVIAGLALANREKSPPRARPCDLPSSEPSAVTAPATQAPGGGGLRVVEKGFAPVYATGETVSLGAVLENTSTQVAYRTRITFRVFDAEHESAVPPRSGELLVQEVPVILPGQRIGAGAWTYIRDAPSGRPVTVAGFDLDLGAAQWVPQGTATHTFAQISARHQRTERSSVEQETGTIHYSVESPYCRALAPRGVAIVFRNSAGTLVGGSFEFDNARPRCLPGASTESANASRSIPEGVDDSRTESYPYCDVAPVGRGPKASDAPIN